MSTQDKAWKAFKVVCSLVFSAGMLAFLPGTAVAQPLSGFTEFCDGDYDNATSQTSGLFTDIRRGKGINAISFDTDGCVLNITGSVGSASDMWITLLDAPGDPSPPPTFTCVQLGGYVMIHKFDNRKAVGFVTNYDPGTGKGLFFGLYDNGNTDALTISTFDGATGKLTGTVGTLFLDSKIKENALYVLIAQACNDGTDFATTDLYVTDMFTFAQILNVPDGTPLPSGISSSGQIGIAGQAKSAFVDSSVLSFSWNAFFPF